MRVDDERLLAIVDAIGKLVAGHVLVEPGEVWIRDLAGPAARSPAPGPLTKYAIGALS